MPVYEVETPDGVPKDTYAMDGGLGSVHHDANVLFPFEVGGDEDPKVSK